MRDRDGRYGRLPATSTPEQAGPSPGKTTLVDSLRGGSRPIDRCKSLIATARSDTGALSAAIERADFGTALTTATYLRAVLRAAQEALSGLAAEESSQLETLLAQVADAARGALTRAPTLRDGVSYATAERAWKAKLAASPGSDHADASSDATALPHGDRIQQAFGRHDIGGVRARVGGDAARDADALGAHAYAEGERASFASAPDLRTAAHEAAHVVQQRAGHGPEGGLDTPGDDLEQHADAVASAVVAGESAESLLDQLGAGTPVVAIQRDAKIKSAPPAKAPPAYETRLAALLRTPIDARETQAALARARSVVSILAAVPDRDRSKLLARLAHPAKGDELAQLYVGTLASTTAKAGLAALREGVKPVAESEQPESLERFLAAVSSDAVRQTPADPALDGSWRRDVSVTLWLGGAAPPGSTRLQLHWHTFDRSGVAIQSGTAVWDPGVATSTAIVVRLTQAGRYQVTIDLVHEGLVIKRLERAVVVGGATGAAAIRDTTHADRDKAAEQMSDREVTAQAHTLREQLRGFDGKTAGDAAASADYRRIRDALDQLEWQAAMRVTDNRPLDTGAPGTQLDPATKKPKPASSLDAVDLTRPGAVRAQVEAMVRQDGIAGTRKKIAEARGRQTAIDLGAYPEGAGPGGGYQSSRYQVFEQELAGLEALHQDLPEQFEPKARANAFQMLDTSRDEIKRELQRYGIVQTSDHRIGPGVYKTPSNEPNAELQAMAAELKKLAEMKKRTLGPAPGDPPQERLEGDERAALEAEYQIALQAAVARHPSILIFTDSARHQSTPRVWEPERIAKDGTNLAAPLGWELHQKLLDIETARAKIANDDSHLNVWCLPRVIELTKRSMHIAPGTIPDAVIDTRMRSPGEGGWTDSLLAVFSLALGLMLAAPSGGSSLLLAAGEVALVGADLYLLDKMGSQHATSNAFANTSIDPARALMAEVPEAMDLLIALIALPIGGSGAVRALREVRLATKSVRTLREAIAHAGGSLTHPDVVASTREVRAWAMKAFKDDAHRVEHFMAELAERLGKRGPRLPVAIERGEKVVEFGADQLARRFGIQRIHVADDLKAAVSVHPAVIDGRLVVSEVRVTKSTTIGELTDHLGSIGAIERYNGVTGKLRLAWDRAVDAVVGSRRINPYRLDPSSPGFRIFEEVRKHETILGSRMEHLADAFRQGDVRAQGLIDDEIRFYEGELAYWNRELKDVEAGGAKVLDGGIEARRPQDVHREALGAGYPKLAEGQRYRRTGDRTPGKEYEPYAVKEQRAQEALDAPGRAEPTSGGGTKESVRGDSTHVTKPEVAPNELPPNSPEALTTKSTASTTQGELIAGSDIGAG